MTEWTDEALEQYAKSVLLDALRLEYDDTGQDGAFTPSRKHQNEMRELAANPEAWYRKKTEPPWRKYARRLSTLAALAAIVCAAVWYLPNGGEAAAQAPPGSLSTVLLAAAAVAAVAAVIERKHKK